MYRAIPKIRHTPIQQKHENPKNGTHSFHLEFQET